MKKLMLWLIIFLVAVPTISQAAVSVEMGPAPDEEPISNESGPAIVEDKYEPYQYDSQEGDDDSDDPMNDEAERNSEVTVAYSGNEGDKVDQILRKQDEILRKISELRQELEVVKIRASQR